MTYAELKQLIADYMHRSDLTAQIPGFTDRARFQISRRLRSLKNMTSASLTVNAGTAALPGDMVEIYSLRDSQDRRLRSVGSREWADYNQASGSQALVYHVDTQIKIAPATTETMTIEYFREYTAWNDSNTIETSDLVLYGSLIEAAIFVQDAQLKAQYQQLFDDYIERENKQLRQRAPITTYADDYAMDARGAAL